MGPTTSLPSPGVVHLRMSGEDWRVLETDTPSRFWVMVQPFTLPLKNPLHTTHNPCTNTSNSHTTGCYRQSCASHHMLMVWPPYDDINWIQVWPTKRMLALPVESKKPSSAVMDKAVPPITCIWCGHHSTPKWVD